MEYCNEIGRGLHWNRIKHCELYNVSRDEKNKKKNVKQKQKKLRNDGDR